MARVGKSLRSDQQRAGQPDFPQYLQALQVYRRATYTSACCCHGKLGGRLGGMAAKWRIMFLTFTRAAPLIERKRAAID
jgi:hypothetical protein